MVRILIAGIAAGVVMFIWSFISHMMLPVGEMGVTMKWNESASIAAMKNDIREPGLYMFPGGDKEDMNDPVKMAAWTEKYKAGPRGILVYHPTGDEPMGPKMLGTELLTNILAGIAAAFVIAWMIPGFATRVIAAGLIGLSGWLSIDLSLWNWYGFPGMYAVGQGIDQVVGWLLSGVAMALILKPRE